MANTRDVDKLGQLLLELGRSRPVRDPLAPGVMFKLAGPQLHALMWLGHDGALTMKELARLLCVTEKGVTGVGDRLEREGYCRRVRDTHDRRVVRLSLTAKGEALFEDAQRQFRVRLGWLLDALAAPDRVALFRIIGRLKDHFGSLNGLEEKKR